MIPRVRTSSSCVCSSTSSLRLASSRSFSSSVRGRTALSPTNSACTFVISLSPVGSYTSDLRFQQGSAVLVEGGEAGDLVEVDQLQTSLPGGELRERLTGEQ